MSLPLEPRMINLFIVIIVCCADDALPLYNSNPIERPLSCYTCYRSVDGDSCVNIDEMNSRVEQCAQEENFCEVGW